MSICTTHVVFHSGLHEQQYEGVEDRFVFCKVGSQPVTVKNPNILERVSYCESLLGFVPMGSHWAESEFLFALYRTMLREPGRIKTPWIGFLQYDHKTTTEDGRKLSEFIRKDLSKIDDAVVSLSPIDTYFEMNVNRIAMDFEDRNKLCGNPSCYFPMIALYNKFYGTKHKYTDLFRSEIIALCSSFIMRTERFVEMMRFCEYATSIYDLNTFDTERKHRMAGGLMERYYGMWIALQAIPLMTFQLKSLPRF
jgi:hypothetical protein